MSDFQHVALPEFYDDGDVCGYIARVIGDEHLVLHDVGVTTRLKPVEWDESTGVYDYLYDAMVAVAKYYRDSKEFYPYHEEWKMMIDFIDHAYPHIDGPEGGREAPMTPMEQTTEESEDSCVMEFI